MLKEDGIDGVSTARREPIDIGIPRAVVFRIRNGIGFLDPEFSSPIAFSEDWVELSLKRSSTRTSGARDSVVIVLKKSRIKKYSHAG